MNRVFGGVVGAVAEQLLLEGRVTALPEQVQGFLGRAWALWDEADRRRFEGHLFVGSMVMQAIAWVRLYERDIMVIAKRLTSRRDLIYPEQAEAMVGDRRIAQAPMEAAKWNLWPVTELTRVAEQFGVRPDDGVGEDLDLWARGLVPALAPTATARSTP